MRKIVIKNLTREQFNQLVEQAEKDPSKLGIKKIEGLFEYEYIDDNGTLIKLNISTNDSKRTN